MSKDGASSHKNLQELARGFPISRDGMKWIIHETHNNVKSLEMRNSEINLWRRGKKTARGETSSERHLDFFNGSSLGLRDPNGNKSYSEGTY